MTAPVAQQARGTALKAADAGSSPAGGTELARRLEAAERELAELRELLAAADEHEPETASMSAAAPRGCHSHRPGCPCQPCTISRNGRQPRHGTPGEYANHGCRCDACRAANTAQRAAWIASLRDRPFSDVPHGTESGWRNWGCHCDACTAARAIAHATRKKRGSPQPAAAP